MAELNSASFWQDKRVLLTGHTGFKGTWASLWLTQLGAKVTGLSLQPEAGFFALLEPWSGLEHKIIDLRERLTVTNYLKNQEFDFVIHMAAQSLVRRSFHSPIDTYATNLMGTLHLLEALQQAVHFQVILVITSDKVYKNQGIASPFRESDSLGGDDPYSASKGCCELAVQSWRLSGLCHEKTKLVTARAGNVIGGGDWSEDRLIPDLIRAWTSNEALALRYPEATRPWQHVLDVLDGYFSYIQTLSQEEPVSASMNFGPETDACLPANQVIAKMQSALLSNVPVNINSNIKHLPEKSRLTLDTALALRQLGWRSRLDIDQTIQWTADWYRAWREGEDMRSFSIKQISQYQALQS